MCNNFELETESELETGTGFKRVLSEQEADLQSG